MKDELNPMVNIKPKTGKHYKMVEQIKKMVCTKCGEEFEGFGSLISKIENGKRVHIKCPQVNDTDKKIHDILRERQLIPPGMRLGGIEMMQFRAVLEEAQKEADQKGYKRGVAWALKIDLEETRRDVAEKIKNFPHGTTHCEIVEYLEGEGYIG